MIKKDNVKLAAKMTQVERRKNNQIKVNQMKNFLRQTNVEIQGIPVFREEIWYNKEI